MKRRVCCNDLRYFHLNQWKTDNVKVLGLYKKFIYFCKNGLVLLRKNKIQFFKIIFVVKLSLNYYVKQLLIKKLKTKLYWRRIFLVGLGFKMYMRKGLIYLLLGYSHYILLPIPLNIICFFFKKRGIIFSSFRKALQSFNNLLNMYRKFNFYKHKGLLVFKQGKKFIQLKIGKKQQFR